MEEEQDEVTPGSGDVVPDGQGQVIDPSDTDQATGQLNTSADEANDTPVTVEEIALQLAEHIELLNTQASSSILDPTIAGLLGAAIGATAALAGTFWSNRAQAVREAKAQDSRVEALVGALMGELAATRAAVNDKITILEEIQQLIPDQVTDATAIAQRLDLPPSIVFESVADQLGLLGSERAGSIARIFALKSTIEGVLSATKTRLNAGAISAAHLQDATSNLKMFKSELASVKL